MERNFKRIQKILFLVFLLFLFVQPALHEYGDLIDTELLSSHPAFEQPHPEDMASAHLNKFHGLGSNFSAVVLPLALIFFRQVSPISFPIFSPHQQTSVLRC